MRGVNQADHAADDTDQSQGGLIDGAPRGTCCWEQTHREGMGEVETTNGTDIVCDAVTALNSPTIPAQHKHTCTQSDKHIHTAYTVVLQTSQKMGLAPKKRTFGSKTASLWEV